MCLREDIYPPAAKQTKKHRVFQLFITVKIENNPLARFANISQY